MHDFVKPYQSSGTAENGNEVYNEVMNILNNIKIEVDSGIRILIRIDGKGKHGAKYRYNAINGSAADLAINTTQTQNSDGLYLCFNGMDQARLQAETKTTVTFHPYKYHNNKPNNAKSQNRLYIGDNLDVMKFIMPEYEETVDLAYLDIPYNMECIPLCCAAYIK